jgi:gamma-glutamylcyclotransferase (GGCT)/AIG2-like uncharacterized protein YtfP
MADASNPTAGALRAARLGGVPTSLFVYGTLMPGRLRWGLLEAVAVSTRPDTVAGRLYDTGAGWPAARFRLPLDADPLEVDHEGSIPGWVVVVEARSSAALLPVLDEVETGFRRVRVQTGSGAEAWGYEVVRRKPWWPAIERWDALEER